MAVIVGPPANAIRCRPINPELRELLDGAADDTGVERVVIVSGGQTSNHASHLKGVACGWTGSRRHDDGRAADLELVKDGNTLSFTDTDGSQVAEFVTACAARGATGIGAGVNYMGRRRIHVGYGKSPTDLQKLVWGAAGASANAPAWLRAAAADGWNNPVQEALVAVASARTSGRSIVMARRGLNLRAAARLDADRLELLPARREVRVLGFDGEWARVDLQGDGLIDGYVFAAFLGPVDSGDVGDADDGVEEPADEQVVAELAVADATAAAANNRGRRPARMSRAAERPQD